MQEIFPKDLPPDQWPTRRAQLAALFAGQEYGRIPEGWQASAALRDETEVEGARRRRYEIAVTWQGRSFRFPFTLWLPRQAVGPCPAVILVSNHGRVPSPPPNIDPAQAQQMMPMLEQLLGSRERLESFAKDMMAPKAPQTLDIDADLDKEYWPVRRLLERGWATAAFYTEDLAPDSAAHWQGSGAGALFAQPRAAQDAPGALSLWAFGASRVLDVLRAEPGIAPERISVAGHSRGGKTALWAAVQDERFAAAFVNNAGCCGSALNAGKYGESVTSIQMMMGYWFCPAFRQYGGRPVEEMPFDQHMLLAAMAPRPVYVASGSTDYWSCPEAEYAACAAASPAWELLGLPGLRCPHYPQPDTHWHEGRVGYRLRRGGHALTAADWMDFCAFAEAQFAADSITYR